VDDPGDRSAERVEQAPEIGAATKDFAPSLRVRTNPLAQQVLVVASLLVPTVEDGTDDLGTRSRGA
jgi:hypothetical protein